MEPVKVFFRATFGNGWSIIARDGTNRLEDKASVGNQAVAKTLSEGRSVAGIAASTQILPATLVAGADMNLRMLPPDGRVLRDAIDAFFGRKTAVEVAAGIGTGLDFHDLVAAFRPRSTPRAGPNDEPVSLKGGGYSTYNTKHAATNARTATIAANSKDSFGEFDGFQRNLGVGLFISRVANCVISGERQLG